MKIKIALGICFAMGTLSVLAQGPPPPPPPTGIPFDGGLSIFLGLGAAAGVKMLWKKSKQNG